ncbi:GNAT family N-acetyltransferase [Pelomonas sp. CA6]|uniref:GNAT family N-acetyltransferase n=1 Tax=Pelomonas sp. CA6 TaxID=2907999 RepID=UPI001F4C0694|nr:GNAT family N-acetyltransferase [Pelomonas sp. CA6]MCH7343781.1 GNAT family N-acetyltransferase [Pelomonas sp. CA6]
MDTSDPTPVLSIRLDDLSDPRIAAFLEEHLADMRRTSPPESVHALDLDRLRRPEIRFWTVWHHGDDGVALVGTGAIKQLDATHAELKSMRTGAASRGQGIARRLLAHIVEQARQLGYQRLSLETGTHAFFEPAQALYRRHGFVDCAPFGDYREDPNSRFMTLALA